MRHPKVQLWAMDEVHFQRHSTLTRMWGRRGCQPRVCSASTRQKIGFFGALNLKTGHLVTGRADQFNAESFKAFLQHLLHQTHGRLSLILDNAKWHRAKKLHPFFHQQRRRVVRRWLPPYSPELNPIERVWRLTRRLVTHNRYFASLDELEEAVTRQFAKWSEPNPALRVLCANI